MAKKNTQDMKFGASLSTLCGSSDSFLLFSDTSPAATRYLLRDGERVFMYAF